MSVQVKNQRSLEPEVIYSLTGDVRAGDRSMTEFMDESVIGVAADLLITGLNGGSWMRAKYPPCDGCNGWLIEIDSDASISMAGIDAPIPCCSCTFHRLWSLDQWAAFRARMDRIVAAWTVYYGPADADLVAERREWIRVQHERHPAHHMVG